MPTVLTHALVPGLIGGTCERQAVPWRLVAVAMFAAFLPDADVLAFVLHIPYADAFGHRGATHSIAFALLLALAGAAVAPWLRASRVRAACWIGLSALSHALVDALTDGGLGVALFWPLSDVRVFSPWRPIAASPIGAGFLSARGLQVLASEALWAWVPACAAALYVRMASRRR